jgi:hypothetical protein
LSNGQRERKDFVRAIRVLGCCSTLAEACKNLAEYGWHTSPRSLRELFTKGRTRFPDLELKNPGHYLSIGQAPISMPQSAPSASAGVSAFEDGEDPLERADAARQESRIRREHKELVERLRDANARNDFLDRARRAPDPPAIKRREKLSRLREGTAVALASDWHIEEVVFPECVAGRNAYNLEIAHKRAQRFFEGLRWLTDFSRTGFKLRDLILWLGGDLMTGFIHEELAETNELSPVETVLKLRDWLIVGIRYLLEDKQLECITIPCSFGNHGRTTPKRRIKTGAKNSFEWLLYKILEEHFKDEPRVVFEVTQSAHQYVKVYDFLHHFHHGDEVSFGGGVGGISIPINKRVPKWNSYVEADFHSIGHFHQLNDLGHTVVNGSLIGPSEYGMSIGAGYEPPKQAFYVIDSNRGKSVTAPIWVEDSEQIVGAA